MFGYVILHYQNINVTEKCIAAILENFHKSPIVIVDNCSPNGSGIELKNKYKDIGQVVVIINDINAGFANGNNIGYRYMKEHFSVNYIVIMNNDIIIDDSGFERKIKRFMTENNVDVCGPDIITLDNFHQNPLALKPFTDEYLKKRIIIDKIKSKMLNYNLFYKMYIAYKKKHRSPIREKQPEMFDCILHGACIIFNRKYILNEDYAFLPITFMYNEESILYDYLKYKGYKTGYCADTSILHMEGISTKSFFHNEKDKILFRFKCNTESLKLQLKERDKYKMKGD